MKKKQLSHTEISVKGGKARAKKAGSVGMAAIGAKGRETIMKKDPDFYKRLAKAGLEAREKKKKLQKQTKEQKKSLVDSFIDSLTGNL